MRLDVPLELNPGDPLFPARLLSIPDPPARLYVAGDPAVLGVPGIAVIGTRSPSAYGEAMGTRLSRTVAKAGLCIVSGLAEGCDTAAHTVAVRLGTPTVAILPGGTDRIFPPENEGLARAIVDSGGAVLSEYPPGTDPEEEYFGARDRLQSGLSLGVIVIETDIESGTLITVGHARRQGRPIAVLATHPPEYRELPSFQGNKQLLDDGEVFPIRNLEEGKEWLTKWTRIG
ncbi:MAG: DNA-processing protein DprA [Spirochaetia bacterium]